MRQQLNRVITRDELMIKAPSVFATESSEKTSDKYLFVPTIDVVEQIESQGFSVINAGQSKRSNEHAKHFVRFRRTELIDKQLMTLGDSVPELVLFNSHDGLSSFQLRLGVFRMVCSNGLIAGDTLASASVRHMGYSHDKIINAQFEVLSNETKLIESVERMKSVQLNDEERLALATSALTVRYEAEDTKPQSKALLQPRRFADQSKDLWTTFNVIQENMLRGGLRTVTAPNAEGNVYRGKSTRAITSVNENKRLNQALWTLSEEMLKIKGA